jgi:dipeptidyl aminopeptidase/acylaminoacyl peptidase
MKALAAVAVLLVLALPAAAAAPRILPAQDAWPVWSPDGSSIAFTRIDSSGMTLELLRLASPRRVTAIARNTYQLEPSWSPDGRALAYQAHGGVYVWRAADGKATGGACSCGAPALGDELAYVRGTDLYVAGTPWASGVIGEPAWEPGGERLAFQRDDGIYLIQGRNGFPGTPELLASASNPGRPIWSPDARLIAYTSRDRVYVVAADGSTPPVAISPVLADLGTPSWSREADSVVYSRQGAVEVSTLGGSSSVLVPSAGLGAAFSPLDDSVAFAGPRPGCPAHIGISLRLDNVHDGPIAGTCEVRGTAHADVIEGSPLWGDVILAGAGNDLIHANDGHTDRVDCGPGRDTVWADRSDRLTGCEIVHR